jgi:hypothetical protein
LLALDLYKGGILVDNFTVRPYEFDSNDEVLELFHSIFKPWMGNKKYFEWKYEAYNPGITFPSAWVVKDEGRIVMFNGFSPRKIRINSKSVMAIQWFDVVNHPAYRGMDLFNRVSKRIFEEMLKHKISWVYGYGNKVMFRLAVTKLKFAIWSEQIYLSKVLDKDKYAKSKFSNPIMQKTLKYYLELTSRRQHNGNHSDYEVKQLAESGFTNGINKLVEVAYKDFDVIGERDKDFLNWSLAKPNQEYLTLCAYRKDELEAYIIFRVSQNENSFEIVDCIGKNQESIATILSHIENLALAGKCGRIVFKINMNHPYKKYFEKCGYKQSREKYPIVSKVINDKDSIKKIVFGKNRAVHWSSIDRSE